MPKDEFEWIKENTPSSHYQRGLIEGVGDDAAVYREATGFDQLLCVDTMVEGVHFRKDTMSPEDIGYKALAVNISDIAAMGGVPVYFMVSMAIPPSWSDKELEGIYKGMRELAGTYQMDLIGGDTVSSPHELVLSVTVHGRIEKGLSLYRSNARPGDYVFLTGCVGRSAAGLQLLLDNKGRFADFNEGERRLINCHQRPVPRVDAGRVAAKHQMGIALNDISDGLASEVNEIAEASSTSIELIKSKIPVAKELHMFSKQEYWKWIFNGGEDFELVGTVREEDCSRFRKAMKEIGSDIYLIGRVKAGEPLVTLIDGDNKEVLSKEGYNHFKHE